MSSTAWPIDRKALRVCSTTAGSVGGLVGAVLDDVDRGRCLVLDRADQPGDLLRGLLGLLGQLADLLGDDREPAALLARAGGLDRGVQCEQVGLLGDPGDRLHDVTDLLRLRRQLADRGA